MYYIITFSIALILGFIAGALFFRNNARKLTDKEMEGKRLIDALKGR